MREFFDSAGVPESWGVYMTTFGAMLVLAGLDFVGAICAKEWTLHRQHRLLIAGAVTFLVLFLVYARILKTAELSLVTIGWVLLLQVGLLLVDRFRYGVTFSNGKWIAIVLVLALQGYLVLAPNADADSNVYSAERTMQAKEGS